MPGVCFGICTLVLETKNPHWLLEEPLMDHEIAVQYSIYGDAITYRYTPEMEWTICELQNAISKGHSFWGIINALNEKRKKEQEQARNEKRGKNKNPNQERKITDFERAKKLYGLEIPYTMEELHRRKRALLKNVHPDQSNDPKATEKAQEINRLFDVLKQYADRPQNARKEGTV